MRSYAPYNTKLFHCENYVEAEAEIGEIYLQGYTVFVRCSEQDDKGLCKQMKKQCKFSKKKISEKKEEFFPTENVYGLHPMDEK